MVTTRLIAPFWATVVVRPACCHPRIVGGNRAHNEAVSAAIVAHRLECIVTLLLKLLKSF